MDVERVFSHGRLLLSHVRSRLSVQSTRALLCLGAWIKAGIIMDNDLEAAMKEILKEFPAEADEHEVLEPGWDLIEHN